MGTLRTKLGHTIWRLRREAGLSRESFADKCRVRRTYMGAVERGETNIFLDNLERIAKGLDLTVGELLLAAEKER